MERAVREPFGDLAVRQFATRLASPEPVPGGGSASAVAGSLAASLVAMVAALSEGRERYAEHAPLHAESRRAGEELSDRLLALADEDADAYGHFAAALKLPRGTAEEATTRTRTLHGAARRAAEVPLRCVEACLEVVVAAEALAGRSNKNASSDLNVAVLLGEAAARGAAANVLVNLPSLPEGDPFVGQATARVDALLHDIKRLARETREMVASGVSRDPVQPASAGRPG